MGIGRTLLMIGLLAVAAGCPPKNKDKDTDDNDLPPPTVKLQVAAIDPAFGTAEKELSAEVFGSGFEKGARVSFSASPAEGVRFVDENSLRVEVPALPPGAYDVVVTNPDGTKATLRKGLTLTTGTDTGAGCKSATVHFDFDSTVLSASTRKELDGIASCLRGNTVNVRVEGHCDERGTTDYNIALGQRRADAVQRYLVGQGVSPNRLRTVSYGEERPIDRSGTDSAHAQNRRAEIIIRE